MKIKCDTCKNNVLSDETDVGCGFVPYCRIGHWGGFCEQDFDENLKDVYCEYRDNCKDYEMK